jgi:ATP-binding cassette, subfamily A (ABC1), member 3
MHHYPYRFFFQMRASFVSVNLFSLLCLGNEPVGTSATGTIARYGGPILYLFIYSFVLFGILVWVDSGSVWYRRFIPKRWKGDSVTAPVKEDVAAEAKAVSDSNDALRVLDISKSFGGKKVVDHVSLGVAPDTIFALLGPNGAGKTTTFNVIRR